MEEDQNISSTYIEPEKMDRFVKEHVDQQPGLNGEHRDETFASLTRIWIDLGFDREAIEQRIRTANKHVSQLFDQMQIEEQDVLETMKADLAKSFATIRELNEELGRPPFRYDGPPQLVAKAEIVQMELEKLERQKETAMIELHRLKNIEEKLCEQLEHASVPVSLKVVPKVHDLEQIKQNIHMMEKLVQARLDQFRKLKYAITSAFDLLGEAPKEVWLQDILEAGEDPFVVLKENVNSKMESRKKTIEAKRDQRQEEKDKLEDRFLRLATRLEKEQRYIQQFKRHDLSSSWLERLREELNSLEAEKKSKLKELIESCREDIAKLWEKMYFSQEQRESFFRYYSENYNEQLLEDHENILRQLEEEFSQHANMFKGVDQWNELFQKYRVMDAEDKDPNRFKNNRGGALLKKQKEFKKVKVQLTNLENQLKADINEWEKDNEKEFQVDGVGFKKYIETQWDAVCESKNMERLERNQKKKIELAREMTYGTTPTKRTAFGSTMSLADTKRSRIDITAQSKFSRIPNIPPFRRPFGAPSRPAQNDQPPQEHRLTKKSRRRSKSASNILQPYSKVISKVTSRINTFRTPQPVRGGPSRIPQAQRGAKTEVKPKKKLFSENERMEVEQQNDRICQPILEDKENDSNASLEFESAENLPFGGPTSIKSAPHFDEGPPLSYEEFGENLGNRRHIRSSAIGYGFSHEI